MMTIERATTEDTSEVVRILAEASAWLHSRGLDQWPEGFAPPERIRPYIACGEVFIVRDEAGQVAATARVNGEADAPGLWTPAELQELALYVSKLAIDRRYGGTGLGELVLRWITDHGHRLGYKWIRLDAWRSNDGLHAYYATRGWSHVRTVTVPWRNSTALFQRPTAADPEARAAFGEPAQDWMAPGTRVVAEGGRRGTISTLSVQSERGIVTQPGEFGVMNLPGYWVRLDDGSDVFCLPGELKAAGDVRSPA